jgi:hypothetical protein
MDIMSDSNDQTANATQHPGWPIAELDPIRRLNVLATAVPGFVMAERHIPHNLASVWGIASDLEQTFPQLGGGYVTSLRIVEQQGEHIIADVRGKYGLHDTFRITLRPGWCWMEGKFLIAAMAARPEGESTRFAWASQITVPGGRFLTPLATMSLRRTLVRLEHLVSPG